MESVDRACSDEGSKVEKQVEEGKTRFKKSSNFDSVVRWDVVKKVERSGERMI